MSRSRHTSNVVLRDALALAQLGYAIFPVHTITNGQCSCNRRDCPSPGKHPIAHGGFYNATTDTKTIGLDWKRKPKANIGVRTGNNFFVLDVDPRHGGNESLAALQQEFGRLPSTQIVNTGGGGTHHYYKTPIPVGNRSHIRPGLDVRGDGGYVVAPPSIHASGERYEFNAHCIWEVHQLPLAPDWLLRLIVGPSTPPTLGIDVPQKNLLSGAVEGHRNSLTTSYTGRLVRLGLAPREIARVMLSLNDSYNSPPLPKEEVLTIVNSIVGTHQRNRRNNRYV